MYFVKNLFVGASLIAAALAQSKLGFTSVPTSVEAGTPTILKWSGGTGTGPVTITLKKGLSTDLKTVLIITGSATGTSFTWTPPKSLADGDDYAFQISQGVSDVNYSGQFTLSGGSGSSVSKTSASSSSASATSASKSSASVTSASKSSASVKSVTSSLSSLLSSISSVSSANNTHVTTTVAPINATSSILIGTGVGTAASSGGTGIHTPRNTTLSHATLKSSTKTAITTSSAPASTQVTGTATSPAGSSNSPAGSSKGAPSGNSAANLASPLAFVITAFVAIIYLG